MILLFSICLDNALQFFLSSNGQYVFNDEKLDDLGKKNVCVSVHDVKPTHTYTHTHTHIHILTGSRVQKKWYAATLTEGEERKRVILTAVGTALNIS